MPFNPSLASEFASPEKNPAGAHGINLHAAGEGERKRERESRREREREPTS